MSRYIIFFALRVINYVLCDPVLWSFEGAESSLPARDAASLFEFLQTFRRNVLCVPSKSQAVQRRPFTMNTLSPFERSGTTRPMTRLSHRGRTERFGTSLCETKISHRWTWLIPTLHESAGTPRQNKKKTVLTRCVSFKPRIEINTIFTLYIQMEH